MLIDVSPSLSIITWLYFSGNPCMVRKSLIPVSDWRSDADWIFSVPFLRMASFQAYPVGSAQKFPILSLNVK